MRLVSAIGVPSATPGGQVWASTLPGGCCGLGAVSPSGRTVFVSGYQKAHFETVAYGAATGARLWATAYRPGGYSRPRAIAVSQDGAKVYVTGDTLRVHGSAGATVAYDAATGRQLWVSRYVPPQGAPILDALAVSPDNTTVYAAGLGWRRGGNHPQFLVIAYAAATGRMRWLRYYATAKTGAAASVAVSPDGNTVYATGSADSSALTVAYRANGSLKWTAWYKYPKPGYAAGDRIVAGPGGAVYVAGSVDVSGRYHVVTLAYRTATGSRMWLRSSKGGSPDIAVTPGGRSVVVAGPWEPGGYAIAAYNAITGRTRWTRLAPDRRMFPEGLAISPHGNTVFTGGNYIAAYSVAHGTLLWLTSHASGSCVFGVSADGTSLFGTVTASGGITTIAYRA